MGVEDTLALVTGLAKVVQDYRLDELTASGITLRRSLHDTPDIRSPGEVEDPEALLYHSANGGV